MAVPAGIPSIAQQEMAVNAKIVAAQQLGNKIFSPRPEDAEDQWASFKTAAKDFGIGIPANVIGMPADLVGMVTMAGYSGLNWAKGGEFTMIDFTDIPGTSENIGAAFGADTKSGAFLASAFTNPEGGLLKAAAVGKAMFIGARALTDVSQGTLAAAKSMEKLGRKQLDVWKDTGWFKDDDNWKFILSDEGSVVNTDAVKALLGKTKVPIGEGGTISGTLGSLFQHDALYKAYPQLKDVPLHMDYVRWADDVDGKAVFELTSRRQRTITGQTHQGPAGPEVAIFRPRGDMGREVILHEVQHLVQQIEGFSGGTNSKAWLERITGVADANADVIITRDIASGKIDLDSFLSDPTYFTYLEELAETTGIRPDKLEGAIQDWMRPGVDIKEAAWQAQGYAKVVKRDLRVMIEELSKGLSEANQIKLADIIVDGMPHADAQAIAGLRYSRQGGEIEARLTARLRDKTQEELAKMASPKALSDVPLKETIE